MFLSLLTVFVFKTQLLVKSLWVSRKVNLVEQNIKNPWSFKINASYKIFRSKLQRKKLSFKQKVDKIGVTLQAKMQRRETLAISNFSAADLVDLLEVKKENR